MNSLIEEALIMTGQIDMGMVLKTSDGSVKAMVLAGRFHPDVAPSNNDESNQQKKSNEDAVVEGTGSIKASGGGSSLAPTPTQIRGFYEAVHRHYNSPPDPRHPAISELCLSGRGWKIRCSDFRRRDHQSIYVMTQLPSDLTQAQRASMKLWTLMVRRTREYYLVAVVDMTHHVALAVEALERLGDYFYERGK